MPGMQMPMASPNPQASSPQQKMEMNMPMPAASPGASPQKMERICDALGKPFGQPDGHMPGMDMGGMKMDMGPLMVMTGNDRVSGLAQARRNVMSMGAMGSGTACSHHPAQCTCIIKSPVTGCLCFHYNLIAGLNRQGDPRGVTKFDSQNWFMPMAYRKVGKGTLQLRGMFSAEPFTFPPGGSPLLFKQVRLTRVNH